MHAMRTTAIVIGFAVISAAGATAQKQETKTTTETKTEVKQGKDVTVTGCLERLGSGDYVLTGIRQNRGDGPTEYVLVGEDNLSKHVGQRVEIRGKAVTRGQGTVSTESKTKVETDNGPDLETKTTTQGTTGEFDRPVVGVSSMKTRSSSCR
jgi:hypothetical protein